MSNKSGTAVATRIQNIAQDLMNMKLANKHANNNNLGGQATTIEKKEKKIAASKD